MEKQMSKRLRLGLIAVILAIVAILATIWALVLIHQHYAFLGRHVTPPGFVPGDFQLFYVANTIISTINIALLVILLVIYVNIYLKTRSPFTIGLVIFALVFLVRDLTSSPFVTAIYGFRAYGLGPFAFLPSLFELIALSVLLYLSVKY
ncbi:MAG: hypothetical protein ABSG33_09815 [Candidatus Bathyarchaeia archaeon]|jgi:hypothetical protein